LPTGATELVDHGGIAVEERQCCRRIAATASSAAQHDAVEPEVAVVGEQFQRRITPGHDGEIQRGRIAASVFGSATEVCQCAGNVP